MKKQGIQAFVHGLFCVLSLGLFACAAQPLKFERYPASDEAAFVCPPAHEDGPKVTIPPPWRFDRFYKKYVDAHGLAIVGSEKVCDRSLQVAYQIVEKMLEKRPDIRKRLSKKNHMVAVFAVSENQTDLPENRDLGGLGYLTDSSHTRNFSQNCGGGGVANRPTSICEKNLIGYQDPYFGHMSVLVHEFAHTVQNIGLDSDTKEKLSRAYGNASAQKLFPRTGGPEDVAWMMKNEKEFFAEGTGTWFNAADYANPANSLEETGRAHLKEYDPELYSILANIYPNDDWVWPKQ